MITRKRMVSKMRSGKRQSRSLLISALVVLVLLPPVSADPAQADGASEHELHLGALVRNSVDPTTYTACFEPAGGAVECRDEVLGRQARVGPATFRLGLGVPPTGAAERVLTIAAPPLTPGRAFVVFEPASVGALRQVDVGFIADDALPTSARVDLHVDPIREEGALLGLAARVAGAESFTMLAAARELELSKGCATCWASSNGSVAFLTAASDETDATIGFQSIRDGTKIEASVSSASASEFTFDTAARRGTLVTQQSITTLGAPSTTYMLLSDRNASMARAETGEGARLDAFETGFRRKEAEGLDAAWQARLDVDSSRVEVGVNHSSRNALALRYDSDAPVSAARLAYSLHRFGLAAPSVEATIINGSGRYRLDAHNLDAEPSLQSRASAPIGKLEVTTRSLQRQSASVIEETSLFTRLVEAPELVTLELQASGTIRLSGSTPDGGAASIGESSGCYARKALCPPSSLPCSCWSLPSEVVRLTLTPSSTGIQWQIHDLRRLEVHATSVENFTFVIDADAGAALGVDIGTPRMNLRAAIEGRPDQVEFRTVADHFAYKATGSASSMRYEWAAWGRGGAEELAPVPTELTLTD